MMYSVTQRIKTVKQPYGGFVPVSSMTKEFFNDGLTLHKDENVHGSIVGTAVDYLTRFTISRNVLSAFDVSITGMCMLGEKYIPYCEMLLEKINNDDIVAAMKLTAYDPVYRTGLSADDIKEPAPNEKTVENVKIMVNRSVEFIRKPDSEIICGFTLEGGYTPLVSTGDGDYLTNKAVIDLKVLKGNFKASHTLQILMYYLMGLRSMHKEFQTVESLILFNPRQNFARRINVEEIPKSVIDTVSGEVIGYGKTLEEIKDSLPTEKEKVWFMGFGSNVYENWLRATREAEKVFGGDGDENC